MVVERFWTGRTIVLLLVVSLALFLNGTRVRATDRVSVLSVNSVAELIDYYEARDYTLKDIQTGDYVVLQDLPRDFDSVRQVTLRKKLFQRIVLPLIYIENSRITSERSVLKGLKERFQTRSDSRTAPALSAQHRRHLQYLKERYDLEEQFPGSSLSEALIDKLLDRINTIPPSLVLAQATNESGWGTSRFAIRGNNLFGVRTYDESTPGFKPKGVPDTSSFRVRKFPTLLTSVRHYMLTLNTHWAYEKFRALRSQHTSDAPLKLVQGLSRYSERRGEYLDRLVTLIKGNNYRRFDR